MFFRRCFFDDFSFFVCHWTSFYCLVFHFFLDFCFATSWNLTNDCQMSFKRRLFSSCYSLNDSSRLTIFLKWWINSDNSLTQHAASIWVWWINKLYAVFQRTNSINFRNCLKKRQKFASIVFFLLCVEKNWL